MNSFKRFYAITAIILFTISCEKDILKTNTYTYYVTAKINKKRFLLPIVDYDNNSNILYDNTLLRFHMRGDSNSIPVEIIIYGIRLDTLKLPAKIPMGNFSISLRDKSIVKPNNEKCKSRNLDCYYVANNTSTEVNVTLTKFTKNIVEGTFEGNFHAYGFNYLIVNDLEDKIKVTEGYFNSIYRKQSR